MYSKEHLERLHSQVVTIQEQLQRDIDEYLKDKSNSLEDRWEVWTKYSQKDSDIYYHEFPQEEFPDVNIKRLNDWACGAEGYPSRYETVEYNRIVDKYEDLYDDADTIKEYLMNINLGSYTMDW